MVFIACIDLGVIGVGRENLQTSGTQRARDYDALRQVMARRITKESVAFSALLAHPVSHHLRRSMPQKGKCTATDVVGDLRVSCAVILRRPAPEQAKGWPCEIFLVPCLPWSKDDGSGRILQPSFSGAGVGVGGRPESPLLHLGE